MVKLTKVQINGVDVTSYLVKYEYEEAYGDIVGQVELNFIATINDANSIITGQTLEIWTGFTTSTDNKLFSGYIESFNLDGGLFKIIAKDKLWDLIRKEVNHKYDKDVSSQAGVISAIFKDLVTTYGGLNADDTTIQNSGTTETLQKFVCEHTDIFERCKALARALNWQFYYRADTDMVYFEPKGKTLNSAVLSVGDNIIRVPKWYEDNVELCNDITIAGTISQVQTTETGRIGVTSGYTTTAINITQIPISTKVYYDAANPPTTLKTGGLPNSTLTYDYYVDKENKQILPKTGTTFPANDYVKIDYTYGIPTPVHESDAVSVATYGEHKKTFMWEDIRYASDARVRAILYLDTYKDPFVYTTLQVKSNATISMRVGEQIRVIDNVNRPAKDENLVITKRRVRYPGDYEEIDVGDEIWRTIKWYAHIEEELKRLKEKELENQEVITEIVANDYDVEYTHRYTKNENINGGTTLLSIQQHNNKYTEDFADTDFLQTTDGTWETATATNPKGVLILE